MKRPVFALLISLFSATATLASAYTLDEVLNKLEINEKSSTGVRFNFNQKIDFAGMDSQTEIRGHAQFGKSGKMRVAKEYPDKQLTVSDGKKVWVYNPAHEQVWEGRWKDWVHSSALPKGIIPFDNYVADLKKDFTLTLVEPKGESESGVTLNMEPKDKNLGYRLELNISTESWLPTQTVFVSDSARIVTQVFNFDLNPTVDAKTFRFSAPKGVETIQLN